MQTDGRISGLRQRLDHWALVVDIQPWNQGAKDTYERLLGEYEAVLGEVEVLSGRPCEEETLQGS